MRELVLASLGERKTKKNAYEVGWAYFHIYFYILIYSKLLYNLLNKLYIKYIPLLLFIINKKKKNK